MMYHSPVVLGGFPDALGVLACYCFLIDFMALELQDCNLSLIRDIIKRLFAEKDHSEMDCRLCTASST